MPNPLVLLTAFAPAVWGTTYLVTTELLPAGHPLFAALLRALPAGLLALLIGRRLPRGTWWWKATVLGMLNIGAFFPLLFIAAERLPGGVAAALGGVQPLVVVGLGAAVLAERVRATALVAGTLGALGVALIVLTPAAGLDMPGILAGIGGVTATGAGIVLTKRWGRPAGVGAVSYAGWQLTAGGLLLLPLTLGVEGVPHHLDQSAVLGYLWLGGMGGLVAYALWFHGIQRLPIVVPGLLVLLSPTVATVLGAVIAGERFTPLQLLGIVFALAAMIAGPWAAWRRSTAHPDVVGATAERAAQPLPKSF